MAASHQVKAYGTTTTQIHTKPFSAVTWTLPTLATAPIVDIGAYEFTDYPESQQPVDTLPVYRFWSDSLETHFYTMNETEKNKLIDNYPHVWTYEGTVWYAYE